MSKWIILCLLILGLSIISASKSGGMREHRSGNTAAGTPQQGRLKELGLDKNSSSEKKKRSQSRRQHVAGAGAGGAQLNFGHEGPPLLLPVGEHHKVCIVSYRTKAGTALCVLVCKVFVSLTANRR